MKPIYFYHPKTKNKIFVEIRGVVYQFLWDGKFLKFINSTSHKHFLIGGYLDTNIYNELNEQQLYNIFNLKQGVLFKEKVTQLTLF